MHVSQKPPPNPKSLATFSHAPGLNPTEAYEKVASDLGLGVGFRWVLRLLPPVTIDLSRLSRNMAEKVTIKEIPNIKKVSSFLPLR